MVNLNSMTDEDALVIEATGRVDEADSAAWAQALEMALASGRARIVIDVSALEYIGGAGLRALARVARHAAREGRELRLAAPSPALKAELNTIGLWGALPTYGTRESAAHGPV